MTDRYPRLGRSHQLLKLARELKEATGRREHGLFLAEGRKLIGDLLREGHRPEHLLVDADRCVELEAELALAEAAGVAVSCVTGSVLEALAPARTGQGLLAMFVRPSGQSAATLEGSCVLLLDRVSDPGNLGTLLRTARAAGVAGAICVGGADPYGPRVVRAAAGAILTVPIWTPAEGEDAPLEQIRQAGFALVACNPHAGQDLYACQLPERVAWLLGSESDGLSSDYLGRADLQVRIPMCGGESLNVAISGALLMFEHLRRRGYS